MIKHGMHGDNGADNLYHPKSAGGRWKWGCRVNTQIWLLMMAEMVLAKL